MLLILLGALCGIGIYLSFPKTDRPVHAFHTNLPENLAANLKQGTVLFEQGQLDTVETLYNQMIQDYPSYPHGYNNLAALQAFRGNLDQARVLLEQAMATDQGYESIYRNLGKIYAELARDSYSRALQLDPVNHRSQLQILDAQGTAQLETAATQMATTSEALSPPGTPAVPVEKPVVRQADATEAAVNLEQTQSVTPAQETPENFIRRWAAAWSAQDVDAYLNCYAADYLPRSHKTRADWEKNRRSRIIRPAFVELSLDELRILSRSNDKIEIELVQGYRNDRFQDRTRKHFELMRQGQSWVITSERSLGSLH